MYPSSILFIPCLFTSISFYRFANPNLRLSLSIPFSLSLSIHRISTYICFYLLSIHFYLFIPLCQFRLMPISFYLFVNPNSRLYLSNPFSLSQSILCISTYICFYLLSAYLYFFISLCKKAIDFMRILLCFHAPSIHLIPTLDLFVISLCWK